MKFSDGRKKITETFKALDALDNAGSTAALRDIVKILFIQVVVLTTVMAEVCPDADDRMESLYRKLEP